MHHRAFEQRREIALEVLRVLFRGLSVYADGSLLPRQAMCLTHEVDVDVVCERSERHRRRFLRQLRYSFESR